TSTSLSPIYTPSLHDALPISAASVHPASLLRAQSAQVAARPNMRLPDEAAGLDAIVRTLIAAFDQVDIVALGEAHLRRVDSDLRSEEHTSELQSRFDLVCRLL